MKMELALMVARFRGSLRPINRIKHVVDFQTAIPVNTQIGQALITATDSPALADQDGVMTGSTVHGIFMTIECVASETSTTATPNIYLAVYKNPGGNITFPNANAVGASNEKKFVIHQEMVMLNPVDGGNPRNIFKGVIKIPPRLKRFGPQDLLVAQLFIPSTGVAVNACTQVHYKEFR